MSAASENGPQLGGLDRRVHLGRHAEPLDRPRPVVEVLDLDADPLAAVNYLGDSTAKREHGPDGIEKAPSSAVASRFLLVGCGHRRYRSARWRSCPDFSRSRLHHGPSSVRRQWQRCAPYFTTPELSQAERDDPSVCGTASRTIRSSRFDHRQLRKWADKD